MSKILIGLGNPGAEHAMTRHNIGFMCVDALHQAYNFPPFEKRFDGLISRGQIHAQPVLLLKPQTYMNRSGISVAEAVHFYKIDPEHIFVFQDDIDLEPMYLRLRQGGGPGGHNGIKSLLRSLPPRFWRIKVGVGRPPYDAVSYVLGSFTKADQRWLVPMLQEICYFCNLLWGSDPHQFTTRVTEQLRSHS